MDLPLEESRIALPQWPATAEPLPRFLQVEPVGQCNLRCQMCPIQFRQDGPPYGPPAFMDFALFQRLVDDMPELDHVQLQGLGEPMMHPRFFDMVEYVARRGIRVSTNTNLTLLNERRAVECIERGLDELHASIDGATAATYERIRVRARFDRITANLRRIMAMKDARASATPHVRIVAVGMRMNLAELADLVRLAADIGVDEVFVQALCHDFGEAGLPAQYRPMRDFVESGTLSNEDPERVAWAFDEARAVAANLGVELRLPDPTPRWHDPATPGRERCGWPWTGAYVSYQGLAMPCCMVATPDRATMGDMARDGVEAVWNGAGYQEFRGQLSSPNPPAVCASCAVYQRTF